MTYRGVDYGISEDRSAPYLWRYTIYAKHVPGGHLPDALQSVGYGTHAEAEIACKQEIDFGRARSTK
jgi:hypothetical protein